MKIFDKKFENRTKEILNLVDEYEVIKYDQLIKIFPKRIREIEVLIKKERIYKSPDGMYIRAKLIGREKMQKPDKELIAALNVLGDFISTGRVSYHTTADPPAKISFVTTKGSYYEIVYVAFGHEVMVNAMYKKKSMDEVKHIVIIEDVIQNKKLKIPGIARFALIMPDGNIEYAGKSAE